MEKVTHAMLMAAGLGTRLKPFTDIEPKPLLPILGVPTAQFALDLLSVAGVEKTVVNIHHHPERAREEFLKIKPPGMDLVFSDESALLLGSAGGIRKAIPQLGEGPFFLLNSDVVCEVDLAALARQHFRLRNQWGVKVTLAIFEKTESPGSYTEIISDQGLITGLGPAAVGKPTFIGAAVVEREVFAGLPDNTPGDFSALVLKPAIQKKQAGVFLTSGIWHDIGSSALWLESHLAMISALETGKLPRAWRDRFESVSHRHASGIWVSNKTSHHLPTEGWDGPAYYDGVDSLLIPKNLGPGAVLYGNAPSDTLSSGIGYKNLWVSIDRAPKT